MVRVRFDSFVDAGSWELTDPVDIRTAFKVDEVPELLVRAERAARSGLWAAGWVSYDAASAFEPGMRVPQPQWHREDWDLPLAWFATFETRTPVPPLGATEGDARPAPAYRAGPWWTAIDRSEYVRQVGEVREHIEAGDTYQANLTLRIHGRVEGDPFQIYRDLALAQRGSHSVFIDTGEWVVASASPELLFEWSDHPARGSASPDCLSAEPPSPRGVHASPNATGPHRDAWGSARLRVRPMKGTASRHVDPEGDRLAKADLLGSAKERAEHIMIVDQLRNDLGRIAQPGSVVVNPIMEVEEYPSLWQLTSTIQADPVVGVGLEQIFGALFPSGSVTGPPKHRTMEIISRLESDSRGVYCGAIGWVGPSGPPTGESDAASEVQSIHAKFNVAIRTLTINSSSGKAALGAGGGITWDSDAHLEWDEMLAKAAILCVPEEPFQLIETLGCDDATGPRRLDRHLDRMESSARFFGFDFQRRSIEHEVREATAKWIGNSDLHLPGAAAKIRILLRYDGRCSVELSPAPCSTGIVEVCVDDVQLPRIDVWRAHKTTEREVYEQARLRHPSVDDVLLVNDWGHVVESTVANLAVLLDGRWWTPPLESGCLPGVERAQLLEVGRLTERAVTGEEVLGAEGLALVSSLRGWRPARPAALGGAVELDRSCVPDHAGISEV